MMRLLALVAGGLGVGALVRHRRHRRSTAELGPSPADELRAKLAEARETPAAGTSVDELAPDGPAAETTDLDSRRRDVHDRARAAIDELG